MPCPGKGVLPKLTRKNPHVGYFRFKDPAANDEAKKSESSAASFSRSPYVGFIRHAPERRLSRGLLDLVYEPTFTQAAVTQMEAQGEVSPHTLHTRKTLLPVTAIQSAPPPSHSLNCNGVGRGLRAPLGNLLEV